MKALAKQVLLPALNLLPRSQHPEVSSSGLNLNWRLGWLKGELYKAKLALTGKNQRIQIGKRLSIQGELVCSGPGRVIIHDDVTIQDRTTLFTHSPDAVIEIGQFSVLNGTRFGCAQEIRLGPQVVMGDARVMDTDFHSVTPLRHDHSSIRTAPVKIGKNAWVAAQVGVLKGVEIGENSVVSFGSVVHKSVPANKIFAGNPAKEIADVPSI